MENILETSSLTKTFNGRNVIEDLNLVIPQGSIFGFLGPNGAGKTTTIKLLLTLLKPTHGTISIFGKELKHNREEILRDIGSLVETPSLYPHLTAFENLKIQALMLDVPNERIHEVLHIVNLDDVKDKKVKTFSLGMKQRLGIAIAILAKPKLLILDEPTNGLDPAGIKEIRELIQSFREHMDMTVFLSSHLLSEIDLIATHLGIINKGKLLFQGRKEELGKSQQKYVKIKVDKPAMAIELLRKQYDVSQLEDFIALHGIQETDLPHINQILLDHHINLFEITWIQNSLEEIFMYMTE